MTKTALVLTLLLLAAVPAMAQTSAFGIAVGGVNFRASAADRDAGLPGNNSWKFGDSVKEAWFSVQLDPGTNFKIKVGEMDSVTTFIDPADSTRKHFDGKVDHIDGIVDYRFSEPFGSTGLFGGVGLYRQHGGGFEETDYGFTAGVNGDFPLSPRYGVVVEAAYHWTHFETRPQYITATAGLRINF
jgi:hypothetical protein